MKSSQVSVSKTQGDNPSPISLIQLSTEVINQQVREWENVSAQQDMGGSGEEEGQAKLAERLRIVVSTMKRERMS